MFYYSPKRSARWDAIQETLGAWVASRPEPKIWNNSLRSHIYVSSKTRRELPYWGSKNPQSTEAICKHFNEIMRFAAFGSVSVRTEIAFRAFDMKCGSICR